MLRILADHPHHTLPMDDLALVTNFLYRCSDFHNSFSVPVVRSPQVQISRPAGDANLGLLVSVDNPSAIQIIGREFDGYLVAWQNANEILSHLA
jgi:hypothetical protein